MNPNLKKELNKIEELLQTISFGEIVIKVQNNKITFIEKKEQFKIN